MENNAARTAFDVLIQLHKQPADADVTAKLFTQMLDLNNVDVNGSFRNKQTLLHKCALENAPAMFTLLLDVDKLDMNIQDDDGNTALMYAVHHMDVKVMARLLHNPQCDVTLLNNKHQSVVDVMTASPYVLINVRRRVQSSREEDGQQ